MERTLPKEMYTDDNISRFVVLVKDSNYVESLYSVVLVLVLLFYIIL